MRRVALDLMIIICYAIDTDEALKEEEVMRNRMAILLLVCVMLWAAFPARAETADEKAVSALLAEHPSPDDRQIDTGLTNLCRCATYHRIRAAVHRAADKGEP